MEDAVISPPPAPEEPATEPEPTAPRAPATPSPDPTVKLTVRSLWEASQTLRMALPGAHLAARALLHAEALRVADESPGSPATSDPLDLQLSPEETERLTVARGAPVERLTEAQIALLELAHERALARLERVERKAARASQRRWVRAGVVFATLAALTAGTAEILERLRAPADLAKGKAWTTSSVHAQCDPAQGRCGQERMRAFFFTKEEPSPWFQVDLGAPTGFSSLTVVNRSDMVRERAVPLVAEASDDLQHWRELARQPDVFTQWAPRFPTVTARYLRLRVDRFSVLHLERVEVHR